MRPSANYWHDANDEGIRKKEIGRKRIVTNLKADVSWQWSSSIRISNLLEKWPWLILLILNLLTSFWKKKMIFKNLILFSVKVFTSDRSGDFVITLEANRGPSGWELHGFNGEWSMKSQNHWISPTLHWLAQSYIETSFWTVMVWWLKFGPRTHGKIY